LALWGQWGRLAEGLEAWWRLRRNGVPFHPGWGVVAARGQEQVMEVSVARLDEGWRPIPDTSRTLECDTLCVSYGFVPTTELAQLLGVRHQWQPELGGFVPVRDEHMQTNVPGVFAAGDCAGIGGGPLALIEGRIAGLAAAKEVKAEGAENRQGAAIPDSIEKLRSTLRQERRFQQLYSQLFTPGSGLDQLAQADTILCRCEGVTPKEIREAVGQGADTLDAVKALTRCGMGNCQGRVCGPLVAAVMARETGRSRGEVGQFRARPPIFPIPLMALKPSVEDQGTISVKKEDGADG
jgi:NAD(P)H-nitrite reductase large subunit